MKVIELHKSATASNDRDAAELRSHLESRGIVLVNLMSAAGSGKTTLLSRTITDLKDRISIGVMEADIASDVDAVKIESLGADSIQVHTDGMCHMDAGMVKASLEALLTPDSAAASESGNRSEAAGGRENVGGSELIGGHKNADGSDLVGGRETTDRAENVGGSDLVGGHETTGGSAPQLIFLENVGNLICPAEYDTGASLNVMLLSVPEGDDKPLKYPLMFTKSDALVITKTDALPYFDFDPEKASSRALYLNPSIHIFPVSAKTGEGMEAWENWLLEHCHA